jgi:hypothetical protein
MINIKILEKISDRQLLLAWREAGRCNYTEQRWALRKARNATTCAMSGLTIRRGEPVYAPVGHPLNQGRCIRSDAVQFE